MNCPDCNGELRPAESGEKAFCPRCRKAFSLSDHPTRLDPERSAAPSRRPASARPADREAGARKPVAAEATVGNAGSDDLPSLEGLTFENYRIVARIGRGGMGDVFRAEQEEPQRTVALKVLAAEKVTSPVLRARFLREGAAVGRLDHPYIVPLYESGATADGALFYAMQFVQGERLDSYAKTHALGRDELLRLFINVCEGVQAAHVKGVIHRDLKPANVLIDTDGDPRILDFGLAKIVAEEAGGAADISRAGDIMGTPCYMAPEQTTGEPGAADTRSDVYALGVMLYYLLLGTFPYSIEDTAFAVFERIRVASPVRPRTLVSDFPADLEAILLKAIAKAKDDRYQSPAEFAADVQRFIDGRPVRGRECDVSYWFGHCIRGRARPRDVLAAFSRRVKRLLRPSPTAHRPGPILGE